MFEENKETQLPESDLAPKQVVAVLKQLEKSSMLRVSYPSVDPKHDSQFSIQIVGTLKFDEETRNVLIQDAANHIEFNITSDFIFQYVDSLNGHPYIGQSLTIHGHGFSLDIDEIVAKAEEKGNRT